MRFHFAFVAAFALALAACGGGGGSSPATPSTPASNAPPSTGTPTATIAASQGTASDLVSGARGAADAVTSAGVFSSVPAGVQISAPTAVTGTETQSCTVSGTVTVSYHYASSTTNTAGDTAHEVFNNCAMTTGTFINGSADVTITRWTSSTDYAMSLSMAGVTVTMNGTTYGPFNYSMTYNVSGGVVTMAYIINGVTVVGEPVVTQNGHIATIVSGTVHVFYGSGWVEYSFNNWTYDTTTGKPTAGTLTITGSNGNRAVITVNGSSYVIAITVNGSTTTFTISIS